MDFYTWMMTKYLGQDSPRGRLAENMARWAGKKPEIKTISSFGGLVDLTDSKTPKRFIPLDVEAFKAIDEALWIEYCMDTGHPIEPPK